MSSDRDTKVSFHSIPSKTTNMGPYTASPTLTEFSTTTEGRRNSRQDTSSTFMGSPVVPPTNKRRTIVLCFDGTGDQFDADNSNIVEFFSILHKGDPERQMVYYQAGIGTYTAERFATPFLTKISKTLDEAIAWNIDSHIKQGYEFLMQHYRKNDRICIFGFSRGAYTARCLAGMLHKVGLLPAGNHQQVHFAYKMYKNDNPFGWKQSNAFKKAFSIEVDIEFLGVWDTVNSVGIFPRRLPFSKSNTIVRTFRHAIALDERRAKFKANTWARLGYEEAHLSITDQKIEKREKRAQKKAQMDNPSGIALENRWSIHRPSPTDVEEVWFAGCHCDVGGGSVSNETKINLARISLRWMIRECFRRESGILFQVEGLREIGMDPASLYPVVIPRPPPLNPNAADLRIQRRNKPPPIIMTGEDESDDYDFVNQMTEEEHELYDALAPKYDQLKLVKSWWLFEIIPIRHRYQRNEDDKWVSKVRWNFAKGRVIPRMNTDGVKVHRSVKIRMDTVYENGKKYRPKAKLNLDKVTWVD
ncbi:hypothetical protein CC2G_012389 [Coprinopsis cinerea AmutBmut pab1-1]|nr:hypothetical protein CC2G_012389 [Coprinopsis cinerea AmutBmut pab1-1]